MDNNNKDINLSKIEHSRNKIDEIDNNILQLLNKRAALALEIRDLKKDSGASRFSPERENEIIKRLCQANDGPIYHEDVERIYKLIMKVMRELPDEN